MSYSSFSNNFGQSSIASDLGSGAGGAAGALTGTFNKFKSNKYVSGATDFLMSNSAVAKFCFFILVILLFVFALRLGSKILSWVFAPSPNPYLLTGMKSGKKYLKVVQDPRNRDSIPLLRSDNEREGTTFTYSVWLYIEDLANYRVGKRKHIFHKGSNEFGKQNKWRVGDQDDVDVSEIAFPNNSPGLFISENSNELIVTVNTFDHILEEVKVPNIPLNKWINVSIRVSNLNLDVLVNGNISVRHRLRSPVKQNYGDVHINAQGGFDGMLSSLRYFNSALSSAEIMDIVRAGPNLKMDKTMNIFPPYFSMRWYFNRKDERIA
tara:strand:- start:1966 stop:2931 length:966 start_codon:yes stop_codon:yes gene_type:complete